MWGEGGSSVGAEKRGSSVVREINTSGFIRFF